MIVISFFIFCQEKAGRVHGPLSFDMLDHLFLKIGSSDEHSHAPIAISARAIKNVYGGIWLKMIRDRKTPIKGAMA
jgi:hypothetical protein